MTPDERRELWIARISDYRASGEGVTVWCERHKVSSCQLWYWLRKLKQEQEQQAPPSSKPQWAPLHVNDSAAESPTHILVRIGIAIVEVRTGFEPTVFADVIRTLKSLC